MKKFIMSVFTLLLLNGFVNAQGGGGMNPEMMKQRLKEELKFSDAKIDSITAIQMEFSTKNRQLRNDNLNDDQRKEKMETYNAQRNLRLKAVLSEDEMKKVDAYFENMRKMRQQRQGGK